MTEQNHYYTPTPQVESQPRRVRVRVRGVELEITTDSGVFAKRGLDYGTRVLLETVQLPAAAEAVDLGCGYGVVAAVLGRVFPDSRWTLLDVNERAIELARRNVGLGERARLFVSDGFSAVPELMADAVVLNPPIRAGKSVVYRLFAESAQHLREEGSLWVVIHKKHGAPSARDRLELLFGSVELADRDAGYHVFHCRAPKISENQNGPLT
ncbi:methyltransferase [Alicyclobacillus sp.]|uniref:class I SAM-dependent methyltransferase n=1 Tax=Alicyclobacillus sp. TaxID=61169 RepID=UPI0025BB2DBD|nr:methyltransferase [Alicyclobacillus sp.]MCL6517317.1 methyltransferase [Alicyclobacillus sp.]